MQVSRADLLDLLLFQSVERLLKKELLYIEIERFVDEPCYEAHMASVRVGITDRIRAIGWRQVFAPDDSYTNHAIEALIGNNKIMTLYSADKLPYHLGGPSTMTGHVFAVCCFEAFQYRTLMAEILIIVIR